MRTRADRSGPGGFTFAEVLAAMLFMAIVLPVAIGAIALANRTAVTAERSVVAARLADSLLHEMQIDDAWRNHDPAGTFPDHGEAYRWELEQDTWEHDTMIVLTVRVFFTVQGQERMMSSSTLMQEPEA